MAKSSLRLLDRFHLLSPDLAPLVLPVGLQRILAFLALVGSTRRTTLAGTLWPDTSEAAALSRLRTNVWRINKAAPDLVISARDSLAIAPSVDVDTRCQETLATALLT